MSHIYKKDYYHDGTTTNIGPNEFPGYYTPPPNGITRYPYDTPVTPPGYGTHLDHTRSTPIQTPYPNTPQQAGQNNLMTDEFSPIPREYLTNPLANVAVQYGTKLMGSGKQMVDKEINRYIPVPLLKLYFAVNTDYVRNKIRLVLFPFINKDWSLKYNEDSRIGPRYDANSPDLYIPLMAYLTYVLIAGVILGINDIFQPESLGIIASQALAWTIVEIIIQLIIIYFISISVTLTTFDILAYSGYKFIGINIIILSGMAVNTIAYWLSLLYCCASMGYFTVQTLKWRLMAEDQEYREPQLTHGNGHIEYKRKTYFLVILALSHVFQMWWLSSSLFKKI